MEKYRTIFEDKFGVEKSEFASDGSELSIQLRGINFKGECFESLEGEIDKEKFQYAEFQGQDKKGDLTNCKFHVDFPIKVRESNNEWLVIVSAKIQIDQNEGSRIKLAIQSGKINISNSTPFGYFEVALNDIQKQLPKNTEIKTCLSCRFSHYHPAGNGMYGGLHCFKKIEARANGIKNKATLFQIWDIAQKEETVFNVQETFDCEEHQFISNEDWNYKIWGKPEPNI